MNSAHSLASLSPAPLPREMCLGPASARRARRGRGWNAMGSPIGLYRSREFKTEVLLRTMDSCSRCLAYLNRWQYLKSQKRGRGVTSRCHVVPARQRGVWSNATEGDKPPEQHSDSHRRLLEKK